MADAGQIYSSMGDDLSNTITNAFQNAQKQQKAAMLFDHLLQQGSQIQIPSPDDPTKTHPLFDTKAVEAMQRESAKKKASLTGYMQAQVEHAQQLNDAWTRMQLANQLEHRTDVQVPYNGGTVPVSPTTAVTQAAEAPQRAAQLEATKTSTERTKQIIKQADQEAGKVNVPGFGMMTPPQLSAHTARMERLDVLKKKSEPILNFENQLQNAYGLGIQDIVDASKPQKFGPKGEYTGTPYVDATGKQISSEEAGKDPDHTFVFAGPNKAMVPLTHASGLGWQQVVPKAKAFAGKLEGLQTQQTNLQNQMQAQQAQQVIALLKDKDPAQMTPEEQVAFSKAKGILGQ